MKLSSRLCTPFIRSNGPMRSFERVYDAGLAHLRPAAATPGLGEALVSLNEKSGRPRPGACRHSWYDPSAHRRTLGLSRRASLSTGLPDELWLAPFTAVKIATPLALCASGEVPPHLNRATAASAASERDLPILRYSLALLRGGRR